MNPEHHLDFGTHSLSFFYLISIIITFRVKRDLLDKTHR